MSEEELKSFNVKRILHASSNWEKTIKTAVKLAVFIVLFFKSYVVTEETYNVEITHNS